MAAVELSAQVLKHWLRDGGGTRQHQQPNFIYLPSPLLSIFLPLSSANYPAPPYPPPSPLPPSSSLLLVHRIPCIISLFIRWLRSSIYARHLALVGGRRITEYRSATSDQVQSIHAGPENLDVRVVVICTSRTLRDTRRADYLRRRNSWQASDGDRAAAYQPGANLKACTHQR